MARFPGFPFQNQRTSEFSYFSNRMETPSPMYTLFPQARTQNQGMERNAEAPRAFNARAPGQRYQQRFQDGQHFIEPSHRNETQYLPSRANSFGIALNPSEYRGAPLYQTQRMPPTRDTTVFLGRPQFPPPSEEFGNLPPYPGWNPTSPWFPPPGLSTTRAPSQTRNFRMVHNPPGYHGAPRYQTQKLPPTQIPTAFFGQPQYHPPSEELGNLPPFPGRNLRVVQFPSPNLSTQTTQLQASPFQYNHPWCTPRENVWLSLENSQEFNFPSSNNIPCPHRKPTFFLPDPETKFLTPLELSAYGMFRLRFCVGVCWCSFMPDGSYYKSFGVVSEPGIHAEVKALKMVQTMEDKIGQKVTRVVLILSLSPCDRCATCIINFVRERNCRFDLWFTKLYKHTEEEQVAGLQALAYFVSMSVSNFSVWSYLIECTNFSASPTSQKLNPEECHAWDIIWSSQLSAILQGNRHKLKRMHEMIYQKEEIMKNPVSNHLTFIWYKLVFNIVFSNLS